MRIIKSTKGVSLPIVTGLVALLMISSVAINELIVSSLQSARRIEASNRAYLAAEAGIEDALYELSHHFAGYETPPLDGADIDIRKSRFSATGPRWDNRWEIESLSNEMIWSERFYPNQKLIIYLFNDINRDTTAPNIINQGVANIDALDEVSGNFSITFSIPNAADIMDGASVLQIDNDEDGELNEDDEKGVAPACNGQINIDCDGDGLVNEDGPEDPVILWRLTDGANRSLIPLKGCLRDRDFTETLTDNSEICEKDFNDTALPPYSVTLDFSATGKNENEQPETIGDFIADVTSPATGNPNAKVNFEFLIIAPMDQFDIVTNKKTTIPYFEYEVSSGSVNIPYPYFTIKSDGYYGTFKQSITSVVTPKTTVPLFDFTIIQQQ